MVNSRHLHKWGGLNREGGGFFQILERGLNRERVLNRAFYGIFISALPECRDLYLI